MKKPIIFFEETINPEGTQKFVTLDANDEKLLLKIGFKGISETPYPHLFRRRDSYVVSRLAQNLFDKGFQTYVGGSVINGPLLEGKKFRSYQDIDLVAVSDEESSRELLSSLYKHIVKEKPSPLDFEDIAFDVDYKLDVAPDTVRLSVISPGRLRRASPIDLSITDNEVFERGYFGRTGFGYSGSITIPSAI